MNACPSCNTRINKECDASYTRTTDSVATVLEAYEPDPKTQAEAMRSSKAEGWCKAMLEANQTLAENNLRNVIK